MTTHSRLHRPARLTTAAFLLAASAGAAVAYSPPRAAATTFIPYQFIAKTYTEGLGRVPDQGGWGIEVNDFQTNGCSAQVLAGEANRVLESPEFAGLNYSNPAKIEVAYRTILNREPDSSGYTFYANYLNGGGTWAQMLTYFEASSEFTNLATRICSTADYGFGTNPPIALSPVGLGYSGDEAGLQSQLNSTPYGGTVYLAARAVIPLTATLVVPAGVTLTPYQLSPGNQNYAEWGRLARQPGWSNSQSDESVHLSSGSNLNHVWVDGARLREPGYDRNRFNIVTYGGGITIQYDRIGNTSGATDMGLGGIGGGTPCTGTIVDHNLIDAYTSHHNTADPSDGISDACEGSQVTNNGVVDASDVAIILFAATTTVAQASTVSGNTVVQAGHGSNALLATDGSTGQYGVSGPMPFQGSSIRNNTIWTSPTAISTFGIADGTYAWFGPTYPVTSPPSYPSGTGASITNNTTGGYSVTANTGIAVSGQLNTTVTGNTIAWNDVADPLNPTCPQAAVGAWVSNGGYASGTIQQPYIDKPYPKCIYW